MPRKAKPSPRSGKPTGVSPGASHGDSPDVDPLSLTARLRNHFFAGILVTAPAAITFFVAWKFIEFVDKRVAAFIPEQYHMPFSIPGVGLLVMVVLLMGVGAFATGLVGRILVRIGERLLNRMPLIRNIYGALKQILETVLAQQSTAFRQVVLVEYPRRGIWAIAFITGVTEGEVQNLTAQECVNVFLPTTPNPTSGFLLFVPRQDMIVLDMSVEEGIKMVISGGIVTPPDRRPEEVRRVPLVDTTPDTDPGPGHKRVAVARDKSEGHATDDDANGRATA
ncbi:DUF502 domain-containing protein [Rhodospira trueperi]|uniref:Uncharacterized membrane protein n=1 Tax=Rhodospira trueperi TaxID=69960 RepID=A0A1G7E436_9PROT|nr:DUF502 domain-containing protein [Rhodospira trueperi]SDE58457.1 Uncharacterized membrane protein [Rhodospira trueperi]